MVEIIGVLTLIALTWIVASSMANESDAEKRRCAHTALFTTTEEKPPTVFKTKDAA
ncbi:MAG TPA: hypothetical protein VJV04_16430 [Nitrospiraceae bacterium]|nr:hypothetical protein [Nitrospiraceae bacterium]